MSINLHLPELNLVHPLESPTLDVVNATISCILVSVNCHVISLNNNFKEQW